MITEKAAAVQSNEELAKLADGQVVLQAEYSFMNPYSINGPFGTLNVTLTDESTGQGAIGQISIQTLFGMGTKTSLQFNSTSNFNPSTGYTTVNAVGKGTITAWPDPPKPITANINLALAPGFKAGTLTVEGFFQDYALTVMTLHAIDK